jgi:hypothetical protein
VAVEADVGVREVVHDDHLVLAAEVDHPLHEGEVDGGAGRVVRERDDEHPRLGPADVPRRLQAAHEVVGEVLTLVGVGQELHRHLAQVGAGEQRAVDVDRVAGTGDDRRVVVVEQHPHQVAEALLRPDRVGDLEFGVEVDVPLVLVVAGDRLAQLRADRG